MKLKKLNYESAEIEVCRFDCADIVTSSGESGNAFDFVDGNGWDC